MVRLQPSVVEPEFREPLDSENLLGLFSLFSVDFRMDAMDENLKIENAHHKPSPESMRRLPRRLPSWTLRSQHTVRSD
jgi:hypothetical protein